MAENFKRTTFKVDTREFERTIRELVVASGKDFAAVANKKLYYVARKSVWYTAVANAQRIAHELGQNLTAATGKRTGRMTMKGQSQFNNRKEKDGSETNLAKRLVNFYRRKLGKKGVYGDKLEKAAKTLVGKRLRSIGFLKAGWIAARDSMKQKAKVQSAPEGTVAGGTKRAGVARLGGATAARPGNRVYAAVWNQASYGNKLNKNRGNEPFKHDDALNKYALPALKKAFAEELADTKVQLEKELRKSARARGVRTN